MKTRISLLALIIVDLCSQSLGSDFPQRKFNIPTLEFPKDFIFSSATSSYQVEGAWNVGGKGENIWDRLVNTNNSIADKSTGNIACDSYHKYKEDVQNMKRMGFKMYRFSLSWSRLFPGGFAGPTHPNIDGILYYNSLIDELRANGIEPMVTLYHWDLPQPLQDFGGWLNPNIADWFADYARACFEWFGTKVKWWITINEPLSVTGSYGAAKFAPRYNYHGIADYVSGHNLLRAHAKAYNIYKNEFKPSQKGKVSLVLNGYFMMPKNATSTVDIVAAERANQFTFGWFGHPVYSDTGDYPAVMKEYVLKRSSLEGRLQSRLPKFTPEEQNALKGSFDFLALNHYSSMIVTEGDDPKMDKPSVYQDSEVIRSFDSKWPISGCNWLAVVPEGLRGLLRWLKLEYNNPEIFITENGYCGNLTKDDDEARISYYMSYLQEIVEAIKEGSKIIGYTAWSLMDNFEWLDGYTKKFGLMTVNFTDPNRARTFKPSAALFRQIITQNS